MVRLRKLGRLKFKDMANSIIDKLKRVCDEDNSQDRKLLLLGEIIEDRFDIMEEKFDLKFEVISNNQTKLYDKLDETGDKLDAITILLSEHQDFIRRCPMEKEETKKTFKKFLAILSHPKMAILSTLAVCTIIGMLIFGGVSVGIFTALLKLLGL